MGQALLICIDCGGDGAFMDWHERKRLQMLLEGDRFDKVSASIIGINLKSEKVIVRLSEDRDELFWHQLGGTGSGRVSLKGARARAVREQGLSLLNGAGASQLDLEAPAPALRNDWVLAITEAIERANAKPADFLEEQQQQKDQEARQRQREAELNQRIQQAEVRRQKYANDLAEKYSTRK
uniref:PH domain-containing protein n=1 Tax=Heterosigma akashiwo TaxID=2829 RepID=A0A6S9M371_HETAK|mmetsp:Transcript_34904/g.51003  ORF Transcript_34904/g.51003 Transcript_34904/m.51003 type:complete len:181 (+) Transcript_34904:80-622(+)